MKNDSLDPHLRHQLPAPPQKPGFETRLKARASAEITLTKNTETGIRTTPLLWTSAALLPCVIGLVWINSSPRPAQPPAPTPVVIVSPPEPDDTFHALAHTPLHEELTGLKVDATRTLQFLGERLPSLPRTF